MGCAYRPRQLYKMYGFVVSIGCANWTKPGFCKRRAAAAVNWHGKQRDRAAANERGYATAADEGLAARARQRGGAKLPTTGQQQHAPPAAEAAAAGNETVPRRSRADCRRQCRSQPPAGRGAQARRRRPSLRGRRSRPVLSPFRTVQKSVLTNMPPSGTMLTPTGDG